MAGPEESVSREELQLATRNHGMPLEALRYDVTPPGLHYLLIHYDIPPVDPATWSLEVGGAVCRPLRLTLDDLHERPSVTRPVTMECAGNGRARLSPRPASQPWLAEAVGTAEWTGVPLAAVLDEAGVTGDAVEVVFRGLDRGVESGVEQHYERALTLDEARRDEVLLAYAMNGAPLPPQHGFPLRLVVPGWYGMTNVKWLAAITVIDEPFAGYQQAVAYRYREHEDDPGRPVTRMAPRSLMVPPGIPEFFTRSRAVAPGPCEITGKAWSGWAPIARVEVSGDGGDTWIEADVSGRPATGAWQRWRCTWTPPGPGEYELLSRATDAAGNAQPIEPPWNVGGYANNAVERIPVTVASA
jgi:sulfane dehydrogenase subunit SoxC